MTINETILDVLAEYGLDDLKTVSQRLHGFSDEDWNNFADSLDRFFASQPEPEPNTKLNNPLAFNFPILSPHIIPDIAPYLTVSDKVYIDDPLSPLVYQLPMIEGIDVASSLVDSYVSLKLIQGNIDAYKTTTDEIINEISTRYKHWIIERIEEVVSFYIKARDLIRIERLVPYAVTAFPQSFLNIAMMEATKNLYFDPRLRKMAYLPSIPWLKTIGRARFFYFRRIRKDDYNDAYFDALPYIKNAMEKGLHVRLLYGSFMMNLLTPGKYGLSTDLLSSDNTYLFRRALEFMKQYNLSVPESQRLLTHSHISPVNLQLPMLKNIPIERVLDVAQKEPDAFENFRGYCNEKLLEIDAPPGDPDRDRQILAINQAIKKETKSLDMVYKEIQQSFNRNFSTNIAIASASILIAGLSTLGSNLDLISTLGKVVAGGGLAASISGFAKECLEYQRELQKLKLNENYFIWKLISRK